MKCKIIEIYMMKSKFTLIFLSLSIIVETACDMGLHINYSFWPFMGTNCSELATLYINVFTPNSYTYTILSINVSTQNSVQNRSDPTFIRPYIIEFDFDLTFND